MAYVNRGLIVILKDQTSTRDIEELVDQLQDTDMVESIGFFPNDVNRLMERHARLTRSDSFIKRFYKRLKSK